MTVIRLLMFVVLCLPLCASAGTNYWGHIQALGKFNTPKGNPQMESYLRSLSPEEMLQAAREYSEYAQSTFPEERWAEASGTLLVILALYGPEEGAFPADRLAALLAGVTDNREGRFFRESMVRLLRQTYWRQLTTEQRRESRGRFLAVVTNKKSPAQLRALACRELELAVAEDYRQVIHADRNVRPLRTDKTKWSNLNNLIRSGEVRLDAETRKSLKSVRDEIANITPTLATLSQDAAESPEVKDRAQTALKTFADLPVVPEQ